MDSTARHINAHLDLIEDGKEIIFLADLGVDLVRIDPSASRNCEQVTGDSAGIDRTRHQEVVLVYSPRKGTRRWVDMRVCAGSLTVIAESSAGACWLTQGASSPVPITTRLGDIWRAEGGY